MKKFIFSAALLMAAATFSFAGNPKGETKEAKTETPTEVKAEATMESTQYAVTNVTTVSGVAYYIVQAVTGTENCNGGAKACLITTSATPDGQNRIPQSQATVTDFRISY